MITYKYMEGQILELDTETGTSTTITETRRVELRSMLNELTHRDNERATFNLTGITPRVSHGLLMVDRLRSMAIRKPMPAKVPLLTRSNTVVTVPFPSILAYKTDNQVYMKFLDEENRFAELPTPLTNIYDYDYDEDDDDNDYINVQAFGVEHGLRHYCVGNSIASQCRTHKYTADKLIEDVLVSLPNEDLSLQFIMETKSLLNELNSWLTHDKCTHEQMLDFAKKIHELSYSTGVVRDVDFKGSKAPEIANPLNLACYDYTLIILASALEVVPELVKDLYKNTFTYCDDNFNVISAEEFINMPNEIVKIVEVSNETKGGTF